MMGMTSTAGAGLLLWVLLALSVGVVGSLLIARGLHTRRGTAPSQIPPTESAAVREAKDALRLRYANGQISREDYLQGKVATKYLGALQDVGVRLWLDPPDEKIYRDELEKLQLRSPDGRIEVHASHQSPFNLRNGIAGGNFNVAPTDIHVMIEDVGGSFGMKSGVQPEYALACWAARRLRRPVKWIEDRTEAFLTDEQAREMRITVERGLDAQHKFTALKLRWDVNLGAYVTGRSGWCVGNIGGTAGVYMIPTIYAESCGIMTHTMPTAAYRGAGRPEATYTIERIIDIAVARRDAT